ncbi:hypothetical protein TUM4637_35170 [Shewanella hafniensis]|nr:hypothetical protein TUM4637_35170 [Shewanella hafniensis]
MVVTIVFEIGGRVLEASDLMASDSESDLEFEFEFEFEFAAK